MLLAEDLAEHAEGLKQQLNDNRLRAQKPDFSRVDKSLLPDAAEFAEMHAAFPKPAKKQS
jgi:hypothetical protein